MAARPPNLFIVGAAKAATTMLYAALRAHPDVFMSAVKEPNYFNHDLTLARPRWTWEHYLSLFEDWSSERYAGEASVWYLRSEAAPRAIRAASPDARIVISLRNPVDALVSLHYELLKNGIQDMASLKEALDASRSRAQGRRLPKRYHLREALDYRSIFRLGEQVERYLEAFPRERVHVMLFDDLERDSAAAYRGLLAWLGLDPVPDPPVGKVNARAVARSQVLNRLARGDFVGKDVLRRLVPSCDLRDRMRRFAKRLNQSHNLVAAPRRPIEPALRREILDLYADDIDRLSRLIGRDLSHWRRPV